MPLKVVQYVLPPPLLPNHNCLTTPTTLFQMAELNIKAPRAESLHSDLTRVVVSFVLFGDPAFLDSPEYAAVRDGFDVDFPSKTTINFPALTPPSPATPSQSTTLSNPSSTSRPGLPITIRKSFLDVSD